MRTLNVTDSLEDQLGRNLETEALIGDLVKSGLATKGFDGTHTLKVAVVIADQNVGSMMTRNLFVPGTNEEEFKKIAVEVAKEQLGDFSELYVVNMKTDDINGTVTGTLFATGKFASETMEKGVDKWVGTTKQAFDTMVHHGFPYEQIVKTAGSDDVDHQIFQLIKEEIGDGQATILVTGGNWVKIKKLLGGDIGARPLLSPADVRSLYQLIQYLQSEDVEASGATEWVEILNKVIQSNTR